MRTSFSKTPSPLLVTTFAVIFILGVSAASSSAFQPVFKPTLSVARAAGAVAIDGNLNDHGWKNAARSDNFVERYPGDMTEPEVKTEVLVTYDADNLYVAFICQDDPGQLRSTMCQRDRFSANDHVCILLDTYGEGAWAYELFVNPYGIQSDRLWSNIGGQEDPGFDLSWESAAQITDSGYQVEVAIPFASMRFPNRDVQSWRMDFWRNRPRETFRQYSWAAYDRNEQCWPCQWGTVDGIKGVQPGRGLSVLPSLVAYQNGTRDFDKVGHPFDNQNPDAELSLGGKYSVSSNMTVEATYNPDFSQIEADAAQINVNSTISLMYPERRPFFQEGSDIFRTLFNSFYSRTINDPQYAAKLTARTDRMSVGFLSAYDENTPYMIPMGQYNFLIPAGKSAVNILRATRTIGANSHLGAFLSDRRIDGDGSDDIAAFDGRIRLSRNYSVDGQFIWTRTGEPNDTMTTHDYYGMSLNPIRFDADKHTAGFDGESYHGTAFISRFLRESRSWNFTLEYNQISPTYRTQVGYDPVNNNRTAAFATAYSIYPKKGVFAQITPQAYVSKRWIFDTGAMGYELVNLGCDFQTNFLQISFHPGYYTGAESWLGKEYVNLWSASLGMGGIAGRRLRYFADIQRGRNVAYDWQVRANVTSGDVSLEFKPIDRLIIEPSLNYSRGLSVATDQELFKQTIFRTRLQYQANRELSLRLVVQYMTVQYMLSRPADYKRRIWDVDPLLTYRISPFSMFYIGSTYDYKQLPDGAPNQFRWWLMSRQFFAKLQYLFQA